ncbi:MAG: hypothetical protein ACK4ND_16265, partial [Cytophagaceae bacterium]
YIHYKITGEEPERVFHVEYKNIGFQSIDSLFADDSLSIQVRLFETSNKIEFHYGKNNVSDSSFFANNQGAVIGLGEISIFNATYLGNSFFITGDTLNPVPSVDFQYIRLAPSENTVYTFEPSSANVDVRITANISPECLQDTLIFEAFVEGGGEAPSFQWQVNGILQDSDSSKFYGLNLLPDDMIRCFVAPEGLCPTGLPTVSNTIRVLQPSAEIFISTNKPVSCPGEAVVFTAAALNNGNSSYSWRKNGIPVGSNNPNYTDTELENGDQVYCIFTSDLPCVINSPDTSNIIIIQKNNGGVADVSISADKTSACANELITFTAEPVLGGLEPRFLWKVNGMERETELPELIIENLPDNSRISCTMISSEACATGNPAYSDTITIHTIPVQTAEVSVSITETTLCQNSEALFIATPKNEGANPVFQWQINEQDIGTNSNEFKTSSLNNQDEVRCIMISSETCVENPILTSNSISMNIIPTPESSIFIHTPTTDVCEGSSLHFTASVLGEGADPSYKWVINNTVFPVNALEFLPSELSNSDVVYAIMQSSLECKSEFPDTSNVLSINIVHNTIPIVRVFADVNPICNSGTINFSSVANNEGENPEYQWFKNNLPAGVNSASISLTGFEEGDEIFCILTSDKPCLLENPVYSDTIKVEVIPVPTSAIHITSLKEEICTGESITFTASVHNPGSNPVYQWIHNNKQVGFNRMEFEASNFTDGDSVWCVLTTGLSCEGTLPKSNQIKIKVKPEPKPILTINSLRTEICEGGNINFEAFSVNAGNNPVFEWFLNDIPQEVTGDLFEATNLKDDDRVRCQVLSESGCKAVSNTLAVSINHLLAHL